MPHSPCRQRRRAFTLIEAALVTAIIGIGVVAMLQLLAAGTVSNDYAMEMTTGVNLANDIHEIAIALPFFDPDTPNGQTPQWSTPETGNTAFDDLLDLDGKVFSPPIDGRRQPMAQYANWSQTITVQSVGSDQVGSVVARTVAEPSARVTVTITHNQKNVYQTSWLAIAPSP